MGMLPADQAARDRILCELDQSILVEASAGTGKTTSMVGRMIAMLRTGRCQIHEIAAVTFTRKAAAELRGRFQTKLEEVAASTSDISEKKRLDTALHQMDLIFIGTIHSFCARILRERPIEAGVAIGFTEIDDVQDAVYRQQAWEDYVGRLFVDQSPLLDKLVEVGLEISDLHGAFQQFADYPDIDEWPAPDITMPDFSDIRIKLMKYAEHMHTLIPAFPVDRGSDELMDKYEIIAHLVHHLPLDQSVMLMEVLEKCKGGKVTQKYWPDKAIAKEEDERWKTFIVEQVTPLIKKWYARRYAIIMLCIRPAVALYDRIRQQAGVLNYQDLLLKTATLLRDKEHVRRYFQQRYTRLLIDEFQDTDPVQAEIMMLLTAQNNDEKRWRHCHPKPGSLFVVGDPKQSIYRFRRADIITYMQVKEIIRQHGCLLSLTVNFRSVPSIIQWVNRVFSEKMNEENAFSPLYVRMDETPASFTEGHLPPLAVLNVSAEYKDKAVILELESDWIARYIRHLLDSPVSLTRWEGKETKTNPGDFLIITTKKSQLNAYAQKLQQYAIPHTVTGGSALGDIPEIHLLFILLQTLIQPDNPVALLGVLRSELFGFSDQQLYTFKQANGLFDYRISPPARLDTSAGQSFQAAFSLLRECAQSLYSMPALAGVEKIIRRIGLDARAALGGNETVGGLFKVIELLRSNQVEAWSLETIVQYLAQLHTGEIKLDSMPARLDDSPVVRVMNLHKAKGLEAPFVFLAGPSGENKQKASRISLHVDRSGDCSRGYMAVQKGGKFPQVFAHPLEWDKFRKTEQEFLTAEETRLLYVAATRAGSHLVISQRQYRPNDNPWHVFKQYMADWSPLDKPTVNAPLSLSPAEPLPVITLEEVRQAEQQLQHHYAQVCPKTYEYLAAKKVAMQHPISEITLVPSPIPPLDDEMHGAAWGSVLHGVLETVMRHPHMQRDDLSSMAQALLEEYELPATWSEQVTDLVYQVTDSAIWKRAQDAEKVLVEVPFQRLYATEPIPQILRGQIDLAFKEADGWVVVDYKTDIYTEKTLSTITAQYSRQLALYAECWTALTHQPVKETGLLFVHTRHYVQC